MVNNASPSSYPSQGPAIQSTGARLPGKRQNGIHHSGQIRPCVRPRRDAPSPPEREEHVQSRVRLSLLSTIRVISTHLIRSGNESFLLRHVPTAYFTLCSQYHPLELSGTRRLRMHVDYNDEKRVLVYPYFRGTLLELMGENPTLSDANRRTILRHVAEAIHELHSRDWIHLGT